MNLVITDSNLKAGDNGEYFYEYVMNNHKGVKLYFIISKESSDYDRLKRKGFNVVDVNDKRLGIIFDKANFILFSKCQPPLNKLYSKYKNKCIFINHGIETKNSVSDYLSRSISPNVKYICCASKSVADTISKYFKVFDYKLVATGLARWDSLLRKNSSRQEQRPHILISFHWRRDDIHKNEVTFKKSLYLKRVNELLNCNELKELAETCDITFMHHSAFARYKKLFKVPEYIKNGSNLQFQDLLVSADALITDFSSNAYEMAVMNKPTFYYIPDREYILGKSNLYNVKHLRNNSIGKCCDSFGELISTINSFVSGEFELSDDNKKNIRSILGNVDTNNCKRIFDFLNKKMNSKDVETINKNNYEGTGGIWNKMRKIETTIKEESMRKVKVGNRYVYV